MFGDFDINFVIFGVMPYVALTIFLVGSIVRYERDPFTWKSSSSQLLRRKQLIWGSILFHAFCLHGVRTGLVLLSDEYLPLFVFLGNLDLFFGRNALLLGAQARLLGHDVGFGLFPSLNFSDFSSLPGLRLGLLPL